MAEIVKIIFVQDFLLLGSIYIPKFRKFYQTVWILAIFFIFGQFLLFFGQKMAKKGCNRKIIFLQHFFVGKHIHTKFQKISLNGLDFANFLHFGSILTVFQPKQAKIGQKRQKSKIGLCGEFSFTKRHLHTKFQFRFV